MKKFFLSFLFCLFTFLTFSQNNSFWKKETSISTNSKVKTENKTINAPKIYSLNLKSLTQELSKTTKRGDLSNKSNVIVSFPTSDGTFKNFRIIEASNFAPELQVRYPDIRSYAGQGIEDPSEIIRFSVSPKGFQSMTLSTNQKASFIEPYTEDAMYYTVFDRSQKAVNTDDFICEVTDQMNKTINKGASTMKNADDGILRTYRLAMSATGEYTAYQGGTKAAALAAMNATMTRVNGVFENDFNVTMILIANTDAVIYTNASTDPYGNTTSNYNSELQSTLTSVIGEANYDIGHLVANLQNNGNEGSGAQMEPGSGSTIMGYAGITGATYDVQPHSDAYFHAKSIQQVTDYVKSTSCQTDTNTGNAVPTVNAGSNYTIPKGTPFVLTGTASDANSSDVLTYCWEQFDQNNAVTKLPSTTATAGVAFRSYLPTTDNKRYFPNLSVVKTGATSWAWEAVPNVARTLNFRLTVRDNKAGGAANNSDDMIVSVNGTAGPFVVNSPNTNIVWNVGTTQTVTWSVAGTTANGVNAANVDIFLSTDGGDTYPIALATGVPNNGSADILVPNNVGTQNRIMVKGSNHIFFDISNTNFSIEGQVVCNATVPTGLSASNISTNSATISWGAVPGASYDLQYRQVGAGSWTSVAVNGISQGLLGLSPLTQYEAQVRSKCPDNATSNYSGTINFTTTDVQLNYCSSASTNVNDEFIGRVQLNTINNPSGAQFYSDFTSISTTLKKESQYTITITPTWTGTVYNEGYSVWIDYNRDGDFTDAGELIFSKTASKTTPVTGSFIIPVTAVESATRMRVAMKYNGVPTSCETFTYGEVEDYTVIIEGSGPDVVAPVITINGASTVNLNVGDTYTELGATATDDVDGILTASIVIAGDVVNTNAAGTYIVTYNVSDAAGNAATQVIRTVNVIPDTTAPIITLNGASTINLNVGGTYTELGATASDNIDGDLTSGIIIGGDTVNTSVAATYLVTYNVSDSAGNAATEVVRTIIVAPDTTAPVINLIGSANISLNLGTTYVEQGATASDNVDGDISANIVIAGDIVNSNIAGTYIITYNVSDVAGNPAIQVVRSVTVNPDTVAPVITLNGATTINLNVGDSYVELGASATDNYDGTLTSNIVIAGDVVDTNTVGTYFVTYNVSDSSGNSAVQLIRTVVVSEIPNGCSGGISSFPYTEGFENTLGGWTQSTADDIDWTVDANGTPSASTGPSSAIEGSYYIYVEASSPNYPSKSAIINSPCFDLSSLTQATFSFAYHMYGAADMGTIDLEVSSDDGMTWTSIWSQSGNQGNSWFNVDVDLNAYVGFGIQLRFNRFVGSTWQADVAIDDISLTGFGGPDTTAPVITLNGASTINLTIGDSYTDAGATAIDNFDGDISANIITGGTVNTNSVGTYLITYNVSDAAGNAAAEVTRTVIVNPDTTAPVITLNGSSTISLVLGDTYVEQGATATDNLDGNISANIVISGIVDTNTVGDYFVMYNVSDASGNAATEVVRTVSVTDLSVGPTILNEGYFETGWDNWIDGGSDCARVSSSFSYEGNYSIQIRDNSGTASAMILSNIDVTPFSQVEVDFYFYVSSMENGEDFWLRFYDGSTWSTVATWAQGTNINNNTFYNATIVIPASQYNFAANSGFSFQCDASANNDLIYIDQVTIKGVSGTAKGGNNLIALGTYDRPDSNNSLLDDEFRIYPNPVKNILNVKLMGSDATNFKIINVLGQIVKSGTLTQDQIDVSSLENGMYMLQVEDDGEVMSKRFIKE